MSRLDGHMKQSEALSLHDTLIPPAGKLDWATVVNTEEMGAGYILRGCTPGSMKVQLKRGMWVH